MIWFFESAQVRQLEIRRAESEGYEIVIRRPDGSEVLEWCPNGTDLIDRQAEIVARWQASGWRPASGAVMQTGEAGNRQTANRLRSAFRSPAFQLPVLQEDMDHVLVVDDDAPVRELLTRWLTRWGCQVKQASSATEALEAMLAEPASIVFCDIRMPGHDGLWLAERVRTKWPRTAIIMASGVVDMPTVVSSRQKGAVDYVTKPFGRELVHQALERAKNVLNAA